MDNTKTLLGRRRFLRWAGGGLLTGSMLAAGGWVYVNRHRNLFQVRREQRLMETSVSVNVYASDMEAARAAAQSAFDRMASTAAILTRFNPASPVGHLNRHGWLENPPQSLHTVLEHSLQISDLTQGDFDITVAPVLDYFLGLSRPVARRPEIDAQVAKRELLVDYKSVSLGHHGIRLSRSGMAITLDGIAKGYVVDQGIAALRDAGIEYALIDAGGDLRAIAGNDPQVFWNVGIVDPAHSSRIAAVVRLRNAALSTSGNYHVFFSADRRFFHIINPHTGYSPDQYSSVTVMAREAVDSDALSVAAFSMSLPRLKGVLAKQQCQWMVFSWDGTSRWRSKHLPLVSGEARVA